MTLEKKLVNKILINLLTFFRIPLSILFVFLIDNKYSIITILIIYFIIVLTDLLDGFLSKKYNLTTYFGAFFDVFCDYFFIMYSLLHFSLNDKLIIYIIILINLNILVFIITSIINKKIFFDSIGKYQACFFYFLPILILFINMFNINIILIIITLIFIINILVIIKRYNYIRKN